MTAISDLDRLLGSLNPGLSKRTFVFVTLPEAGYGDAADLAPVAAVEETEGLSLVVPKRRADTVGLSYSGAFRCITLGVLSSLSAVGLTAAVASALAKHGISANVVAGFHHDHVFVPDERAEEALAVLRQLAAEQGKGGD